MAHRQRPRAHRHTRARAGARRGQHEQRRPPPREAYTIFINTLFPPRLLDGAVTTEQHAVAVAGKSIPFFQRRGWWQQG